MGEFSRTSLKQIFSKIHDYLYANSNISRNERLGQEFIKIILAKHFDEKWREGIFSESEYNNFGEQFPKKFLNFYNKKVLPILIKNNIFSERDKILLDEKSLIYLGLKLGNINFSDNPLDALGAAFEVFSEGNLAGDQGQFFTPLFMIKVCVEILKPSPSMKILDPACGSGGFLNYSIRWMNSNGNSKKLFEENIIGIDKDSDLIKIAKSFALFMDINPHNFYHMDSLKILSPDQRLKETEFEKKYHDKIDLILTNPPFGAKIKISDPEILKYYDFGHVWKYNKKDKKWTKTKKVQETEPQILFIELCLKILKKGGKMAMVLPEGIFGNPSKGFIRDYFLSRGKVLAVIDCPQDSFMPHTHTKTSILIFEKGVSKKRKNIFMGIINNCGHDSRGSIVLDKKGGIKEDFTEIIKKYNQYEKNLLKEEKNSFLINKKDLIDSILIPNYYDFDLVSKVEKHEKDENGFTFITLGQLEKKGYISIKNVPPSASKQEYGGGDTPFVRTTDIGNGEILHPTIHHTSKDVFTKYKDKQDLKELDILFVKDGTYRIGETAILFKNDLNSLIQGHFKLIRVNKNDLIDPFLLFYLLQQDIVKKQIKNNIFTQATLSTIGGRIYNIKIPLPSDKKEKERLSQLAKEVLIKRNESKLKIFDSSLNL